MSPRPFSSSSFPFLLSSCLLFLLSVVLPPASAALSSVTSAFVNSTTCIFNVDITGEEGQILTVLTVPEDGNATQVQFMTLASPMEVAVRGLKPATLYTYTFSTEPAENETAVTIRLDPLRTHRLGPSIIGFFSSDPTSDGDTQFSVGDLLTLAFDGDTNMPGPLESAEDINKIFAFSQPIGAAYTGKWTDARTLVITILDVGESDPMLGYLTVTVIGDIHSPDGLSDISVSTSPPLIGSWGTLSSAIEYFRPTNPADGSVIAEPNYASYFVSTLVNTQVSLPMSLTFPSTARRTGYVVSVSVLYPSGVSQIGFLLTGQNFSYAPSANIGTKGQLTSDLLQSIVPTVTLTPSLNYVGYSCVVFQLFDMQSGYQVIGTSYINVKIDPTPRLYIPELSASSGDTTSNPIDFTKTHRTALIIGLSCVFGVMFLALVGFFGWRKCHGRRDARDFEAEALTKEEDSQQNGDANGPTRRFYYDAKV